MRKPSRLLMESGASQKRTIRLILFAGEEIGIYGSRGYVADHPELLEKISSVLVMDRGGDVPYGKYAHSQYDTYDTVIPGYLEHSSTVIVLAAHGIANLDHLLSRENLLAPAERTPVASGEVETTDPKGPGGM